MNKMSKYFIPLLIIGIGFGELNDELTTVINSGDYIEAKLFIDNGFDINEKSAEGNTYLSLALALCTLLSQQMGNPIVKGVIDNDSHEFTIDCQQAVEVICKLGGDVNMPIVIGNKKISTSALALAVGIGDIEIIKTLLFYKANPDIGMSGPSITVSPLMLVMLNDNKKMIQYNQNIAKYLIENGADVNIGSYFESQIFYPIIIAVINNWGEVTTLLINHGADLNQLSSSGGTALIAAAEIGNIEMVKILLKNGADISIKDKYGISALGFANGNNHTDILLLLKSHLNSTE